ncbi:MAG: tRNA-uridine aminocarboxypropyltransferase [Burkholderiaceae bacterium]
MPHAVSRLRSASLTDSSTRPRLDRGEPRKARCARCRLIPSHCMCALRPRLSSRAAVCLLMAEFEPLKPSNTGWLIADLLPETAAFAWSRTAVDPALLALLDDPQWQPYVVFPGEFAAAQRVVTALPDGDEGARPDDGGRQRRRPLFVLLDGTWSEARKMFRKSPYLDRHPVLSLQPRQLSRYRLRRSIHPHHFCTAEVAALCLALAGEPHAAQTLEAYLDVFSGRYLQARQSVPADPQDAAHRRLRELAAAPVDA